VVAKGTPDGQYGAYTVTSEGSPLKVKAPKEAGDGEIRYMSGQGGKVLARVAIRITP
jgi:Ca-activated chloride channel family protein